jgi:hypothetical protein
MSNPSQLVSKLWNYCSILRDNGLSYGDYVEQLMFLLFLGVAVAKRPFTVAELAVPANQQRATRLGRGICRMAFSGRLVTAEGFV